MKLGLEAQEAKGQVNKEDQVSRLSEHRKFQSALTLKAFLDSFESPENINMPMTLCSDAATALVESIKSEEYISLISHDQMYSSGQIFGNKANSFYFVYINDITSSVAFPSDTQIYVCRKEQFENSCW